MRGQKRVEDARERAYYPRIHLLRKKNLYEDGWIAGSGPGNDAWSNARFIDELRHASIDSVHISLLQ